jgi:hypothetical protein
MIAQFAYKTVVAAEELEQELSGRGYQAGGGVRFGT